VEKEVEKEEEKVEVGGDVVKHEEGEDRETVDHEGTEDNAPLPVPESKVEEKGVKREHPDDVIEPPAKVQKQSNESPKKASPKTSRKTRSATSNGTASPVKPTSKEKGSQKITNFFTK